jgi:hypothetical protein
MLVPKLIVREHTLSTFKYQQATFTIDVELLLAHNSIFFGMHGFQQGTNLGSLKKSPHHNNTVF